MPPKFKRHLNDDDVTGSVKSERRNLLEDDSDEEEDFFLRGPSGPRFGPRNDKIKHVQNQVDEVIDVMQENITKVIERGERLDELQDKSDKRIPLCRLILVSILCVIQKAYRITQPLSATDPNSSGGRCGGVGARLKPSWPWLQSSFCW
ncbi:PREDICTED: vesicle-associated membrane protein 4 isoform X1 [Miniopterus natalensis]|uniref:vesicle-associated membrane protein 4 isoform X1 n=1 Tax=Miniopterus natalensis TaxID=291302 RepID=UPI0007A6E7A5|nr:PREDICTED: vesicle-associated membrane protein 4 isoform X1 [Miniopterus natalensis]